MPDHSQSLVALARDVRLVLATLQAVDDRLMALHRVKLAAEAFDLECQLIELHRHLLEATGQPLSPPAGDDGLYAGDEPVPF